MRWHVDELQTYQKALKDAGINPEDVFKQVQHYTMSPTEQAISELRDTEAGKSSPQSQNSVAESAGG